MSASCSRPECGSEQLGEQLSLAQVCIHAVGTAPILSICNVKDESVGKMTLVNLA